MVAPESLSVGASIAIGRVMTMRADIGLPNYPILEALVTQAQLE